MAYLAPGSYIKQAPAASGVSVSNFIVPCIIGKGLTTKRIWAEPIVRGQVTETVTPDNSTHHFTLSHVSTQKLADSTLTKDGVILGTDSFSFISNNVVAVNTAYYNGGSVYKFTYVAPSVTADPLSTTQQDINYVAFTADGSRQYKKGTDWKLTANTIDWTQITPASIEGPSGAFDLHVNNKIKLSVDGHTPTEITLTGSNQSLVIASEIVTAINNACASAWGAAYNTVATVDVNKVILTSVLAGQSGTINFYIPTTGDCTLIVFGVNAPSYVAGTGVKPNIGDTYYVNYDIARPTSGYNTMQLYFSYKDLFNAQGPMNSLNDILIAAEIMFLNGCQVLGVIQVQDADGDGIYMDGDWSNAVQALTASSVVTDPLLLNTSNNPLNNAVRTIESEASQIKGHLMGGWFGFAAGSVMGDIDTIGSWVYISSKQLQVSSDSQGRGRYVAIAASSTGVKRTITNSDTKAPVTVTLDSTFVAAAVLGKEASFSNPSQSLLRQGIVGFDSSTFDITDPEASYLAQYGVTSIVARGGNTVIFDPVTTDLGGDPVYGEVNIRYQKDYLANRIKNRLDNYLIGVTPDSLSDFALQLKYHVADEITSAIINKYISPYIDSNTGLTRALNITTDIKAYPSTTNKTQFFFKYAFIPKYCVKIIWGEYVVDATLF